MDAVILGVTGLLTPQPFESHASRTGDSTAILRAAIRDLSASRAVVLLDAGPMDDLESWARHTGVADLAAFRLWTGRLGGQAKAPSRLPFRFVARRLEIACDASLYVGCDEGLLEAARRSGCATWDIRQKADEDVPSEIVGVVEWLQESIGVHGS